MNKAKALEEARAHAIWFLSTIEPLLITFMAHGYKHGWDDRRSKE